MHRFRLASAGGIAATVAAAAYRAHALNSSGAFAAFGVGTATFAAGTRYAAVLFAFFLPSTALSRLGRERKRRLIDVGKGGARDGLQVLANGGVATACAVFANASPPDARAGRRIRAAFAGAYAAATADTWATEIGTLARGKPRSIVTGRPIEPGLSGGVTAIGTLAQVAGATWLALNATVLVHDERSTFARATAIGGIAGGIFDSILGATLQDRRFCPECRRACENDPHACGTPTVSSGGIAWMTNDAVNLAATAAGATVAAILA